jgi:hypothetical protein
MNTEIKKAADEHGCTRKSRKPRMHTEVERALQHVIQIVDSTTAVRKNFGFTFNAEGTI